MPLYEQFDVVYDGIVGHANDGYGTWRTDSMNDTSELLQHMGETIASLREKLARVETQKELVRRNGRIRIRGAFRAYGEYKRALIDLDAYVGCEGQFSNPYLRELKAIGHDLLAMDYDEASTSYTYVRQRICTTWTGSELYMIGSVQL